MEFLLDYNLSMWARLWELGLVGCWALKMALKWELSMAFD